MQQSIKDQHHLLRNSWIRSRNFGLKKEDPPIHQSLPAYDLKEITQFYKPLIHECMDYFDSLKNFLKRYDSSVYLIATDGTILHSSGFFHTEDRASRHHLEVGANWGEAWRGTNAIGTAIAEERPVRVHGREHYLLSNRLLSCCASPLYSPEGKLVGVIDISGPRQLLPEAALLVVRLATETIQSRIMLKDSRKKSLMMLHELEHVSKNYGIALVSLDGNRQIVRANEVARRILGKDCIGSELAENSSFYLETLYDHRSANISFVGSVDTTRSNEKKKKCTHPRLYTFSDIIGQCKAIEQSIQLAQRASYTDYPVLIGGESGTGKEMFAQSIHQASPRSRSPFIAINCSAIPDTLIESELFGYAPGAFTGASRTGARGKFEEANHGTLFLDEIGDMAPRAQAALLRVIQEGYIVPVGSSRSIPMDVRIIAATHRKLSMEVQKGNFRADLYYRLKVISLDLPPIREREDLTTIIQHLLRQMNYHQMDLSSESYQKLLRHAWPGNFRELQNTLCQAIFLANGDPIEAKHILIDHAMEHDFESFGKLMEDPSRPIDDVSIQKNEVAMIEKAICQSGGNRKLAAELLGIGRTTLYRKMKLYRIQQEG